MINLQKTKYQRITSCCTNNEKKATNKSASHLSANANCTIGTRRVEIKYINAALPCYNTPYTCIRNK